MIELKVNEKEFRTLLKLVAIGTWVVNFGRENIIKEFEYLEQMIYSLAQKKGFSNLVEFDEEASTFLPSEKLEDEIQGFLDDYNDEIFWHTLAQRLAMRDLVRELGELAIEKMDLKEKLRRMIPIIENYIDEFSKNGIDNLEVKRIIF